MTTSIRQLHANRRNALKSTGPKTDDGKEASKRNALIHGLSGNGIVMPDEEAALIATRKQEWRKLFRVDCSLKEVYLEQYAVYSVRLERCYHQAVTVHEYDGRRALSCWDLDRASDAARLASRLAAKPEIVLPQLKAGKHGCLWLIDRWRELADALDEGGAWTAEQSALAFDLLGVPSHARARMILDDPAAFAADRIEALERDIAEMFDEMDEFERAAGSVGLGFDTSKACRLVRRYETTCHNRMNEARRRLLEWSEPDAVPAPASASTAVSVAVAVETPAPAIASPTPPTKPPDASAERPAAKPSRAVDSDLRAPSAASMQARMEQLRANPPQVRVCPDGQIRPAALKSVKSESPAARASDPTSPSPILGTIPLRSAASAPARPLNRKGRRAAERQAARNR